MHKMSHRTSPYAKLAQVYDILFAAWGKDYLSESQQLHSIVQRYKRSSGDALLDLGCGTGEHMRHLQSNYQVTGLDSCYEMVELGKQKLPRVKFYNTDMVNFDLGQQFDVIISLFSAIGYVKTLSRLCQTMASIRKHLCPGGVVIIEPWYSPEEFEDHRHDALFGERGSTKACRMRESLVKDNVVRITEHILISTDLQVIHLTTKHVFGLFTLSDFLTAFEKSCLQVHRVEKGLTGRGLYVGVKE